jgi:hypothetical protein
VKQRLPLLALALVMAACVTQQGPDSSFTLSLSAADSELSLIQGGKIAITVNIERQNGFNEAIGLSLEKKGGGALPSGLSHGFDPSMASGRSSTLSLEVSTDTPVGSYDLQIKGSAGGKTQYAYLRLSVQEKPQPGSFSLSVNPPSRSLELATDGPVTTTAEVGIVRNNFTDTVSLSLEGSSGGALPTGISASFNPTSGTGDKSTLTISVASTVEAKTYSLRVKGTAGSTSKYAPFTLTLTPPSGSNTPPSVSITQPTNGTSTTSTSLTVTGSAKDDASVTRLTYQLNGGAEQNVSITSGASVPFSFNASGFREGSNTLTVNAYDAAGAKGSASVSFTFSSGTTPPPPPPSGGANPTLLRSYQWLQSSPEGDQPAVEDIFYRPRQFTANNTLTDAQGSWTINNAGSFQGWDVLLPPNGGKHGSVWQYEKATFIQLTLNREARLAVVWRADPNKVPSWLKNNWTQQGTVRINNADRPVYVKNFSSGQTVQLGSVYDPGQRQAQNLYTYLVLFAEKDGSPSPAPAQLGSPAAQPNAPCPAWVHDLYTTTGPDGRIYPTWHPQVDPVYWCYFGHDHGSDPALLKPGFKPAYGYVSARDPLHGNGTLPEPNPGFKNYVWERDGYRILFVHHFGTGGAGRICRQFHSLQVVIASKSTGEIMADLNLLADFGRATDNNTDGPLNASCPSGVPTPGQITNTTGERKLKVSPDLNGYEPWRSDGSGLIIGLNTAGLTFDTVNPITACKSNNCSSATDLMRIGQNTGEMRLFAFGPGLGVDAARAVATGEFYTDIYGKKLLSASDPGAVRQYLKPGFKFSASNPSNAECFTRDPFFMFYEGCGDAPQAFMNIENGLTDKN